MKLTIEMTPEEYKELSGQKKLEDLFMNQNTPTSFVDLWYESMSKCLDKIKQDGDSA